MGILYFPSTGTREHSTSLQLLQGTTLLPSHCHKGILYFPSRRHGRADSWLDEITLHGRGAGAARPGTGTTYTCSTWTRWRTPRTWAITALLCSLICFVWNRAACSATMAPLKLSCCACASALLGILCVFFGGVVPLARTYELRPIIDRNAVKGLLQAQAAGDTRGLLPHVKTRSH